MMNTAVLSVQSPDVHHPQLVTLLRPASHTLSSPSIHDISGLGLTQTFGKFLKDESRMLRL